MFNDKLIVPYHGIQESITIPDLKISDSRYVQAI